VKRFRTSLAFCSLFAMLAAVPAAHAQGDQRLITPNYRDADIRAVADQLQQVLGRPIVIDSGVSARITLLTRSAITPEDFYRLFLSALDVHGLAAIESNETIRIVAAENARPQR